MSRIRKSVNGDPDRVIYVVEPDDRPELEPAYDDDETVDDAPSATNATWWEGFCDALDKVKTDRLCKHGLNVHEAMEDCE